MNCMWFLRECYQTSGTDNLYNTNCSKLEDKKEFIHSFYVKDNISNKDKENKTVQEENYRPISTMNTEITKT